jgi:hypothetical protein
LRRRLLAGAGTRHARALDAAHLAVLLLHRVHVRTHLLHLEVAFLDEDHELRRTVWTASGGRNAHRAVEEAGTLADLPRSRRIVTKLKGGAWGSSCPRSRRSSVVIRFRIGIDLERAVEALAALDFFERLERRAQRGPAHRLLAGRLRVISIVLAGRSLVARQKDLPICVWYMRTGSSIFSGNPARERSPRGVVADPSSASRRPRLDFFSTALAGGRGLVVHHLDARVLQARKMASILSGG